MGICNSSDRESVVGLSREEKAELRQAAAEAERAATIANSDEIVIFANTRSLSFEMQLREEHYVSEVLELVAENISLPKTVAALCLQMEFDGEIVANESTLIEAGLCVAGLTSGVGSDKDLKDKIRASSAIREFKLVGEDKANELVAEAKRVDIIQATRNVDIDQIELILSVFPEKVRKRGQLGKTALLWAAEEHDQCQVAELLIAAGASLEETGPNGKSPLHFAAATNNIPMAKFLIAEGADLNAKDITAQTPLDKAKRNSHTDMVKLLQTAKERSNWK